MRSLLLLSMPEDFLTPTDNSSVPDKDGFTPWDPSEMPDFDPYKLILPGIIVSVQFFLLLFICHKNTVELEERFADDLKECLLNEFKEHYETHGPSGGYGTFAKKGSALSQVVYEELKRRNGMSGKWKANKYEQW